MWKFVLVLLIGLGIPIASSAWTMTAVGDIMLDRHVRTLMQQKGATYPFAKIRPLLIGDVVTGNLEGPITPNRSVATGERLIFTFDPSTATTLRQARFTDLSIANNHTLNFGQRGLDQTRGVLVRAHITPIGDPRNRHGFGVVHDFDGQRIALIGYHGLSTGIETILSDIREAKRFSKKIIVFAHWGSEYQLGINSKVQTLAHQLIDAGADMVIGGHPHVVEPFEVYRGKFIAYSLGNFIFDQYWSSDVQAELLVRVEFRRTSTNIQLVPLTSVRAQPRLATAAEKQTLLNRLAKNSVVTTVQRTQIKSGILKLP